MIAIISDSHIPTRGEEIPEKFWDKIEEAEITIHAGDYDREETFNAVETYSNEFYGVEGNCDFFDKDEMKQSATFEHENLSFGVYHGTGITPRAHTPTLEKIAREDLEVEILVHGHSHQEDIELTDEVLLLNPGSCTGAGGGTANPSNPTMMTVEKEDDKLKARIIELDEEQEMTEIDSEEFEIQQIENKGKGER